MNCNKRRCSLSAIHTGFLDSRAAVVGSLLFPGHLWLGMGDCRDAPGRGS